MRILFVGNTNGMLNEGMRNVSTHILRYLQHDHEAVVVGSREIFNAVLPVEIDAVIFGVRARLRALPATAFIRRKYRDVPILLLVMQPVSKAYATIEKLLRLRVRYAFFSVSDLRDFTGITGCSGPLLPMGVNQAKFHAISSSERATVRRSLGIPEVSKVVLHVGHCTRGRGLERLLNLGDGYSRKVISSGIFDVKQVVDVLEDGGVEVCVGFIPDVEVRYQSADVYLFPTTDRERVLSVPLSILEALACGIPVVALRGIDALEDLETEDPRYLQVVEPEDLTDAVRRAAELAPRENSLIPGYPTWDEVGRSVERILLSFEGGCR